MSKRWSWNPRTALRINGCAEPVDREKAVRDTDGRIVPEWRRRAVLPPDHRCPVKADASPTDMWAGYFAGSVDAEKCSRLDEAVREGKCVALGAVSGIYTVESVLRQFYS